MDINWLLQLPQPRTESGKLSTASLALRAGDQLTASVLDVEKGSDALLAFGQFKAYARLPLPVVTGQTVRIGVEEAGQGLRLVMLPKGAAAAGEPKPEKLPIRLFEPISDNVPLSAHARSLIPGASFSGRITGFEKEGLKLVDFGAFKAFAKIDIPVREGQILPLSVVKTDQGITLALVSRAPSSAANLLAQGISAASLAGASSPTPQVQLPTDSTFGRGTNAAPPPATAETAVLREQIQQLLNMAMQPERNTTLSPPASVNAALVNLQQHLEPVSPTGEKSTLVARIKDFVENSGIYFEKRLEQVVQQLQDKGAPPTPSGQPAVHNLIVKDFKPNLLILKHFIDSQQSVPQAADRRLLESLQKGVERSLAQIDRQQQAATEKPPDPDLPQAFTHQLFLTDPQRTARLKVYYAKKGRDDANKHPRVSLLLDMDPMGAVRADLWMVGKDLNVTFFVQKAPIKHAIDAAQHQIKAMLNGIFNTVAVSVVVNEKKIAAFDGEDLTVPHSRQVDLSI